MGGEWATSWNQGVASALDWWADAGVDTLVEDEPRDWLARLAPKAEVVVEAAPAPTAAPLPDTFEAFLAWRTGPDAPEAEWLTPRIAAMGDPASELMILTDMPEPEDAESGILLSGAPGRLFDRILAAIGRSRDSVYLAPLAWARPLTGRIPNEAEAKLIELARHHIALVAPKKLLLIGQSATRVQVTTNGSAFANGEGDINSSAAKMQVVATYHPRFLLERPAAKSEAWKQLMQFTGGDRP